MHQNVPSEFISIIRHDLARNQCAIAIHAHQTFFQTNGSINLSIEIINCKFDIKKMTISVDNHSIQMAQFHPHTNINKIDHKNEYELLFFLNGKTRKNEGLRFISYINHIDCGYPI